MLSITPPLLSLQSPRPSSYKKIVTEDGVAPLCIGEQKHERPWNIRDAAREMALVGKDELVLAPSAARPERSGAAAVPATHGCSRTGGARGGPRALPLAGEAATACCLWPARSGSPRTAGGRGGRHHCWRLLPSAVETGEFPAPLPAAVSGRES
jgi:hypothetical protein